MFGLSFGSSVLVLVAAAFTAVAAFWDLRTRRIPNRLTFPVFLAGWIYQAVDRGWAGLADAGLGFLVGFGILFVLWIIGGGGGGDVKLMGALSVWLGFRLTLLVMVVSTVLVVVITVCLVVWNFVRSGRRTDSAPTLPNAGQAGPAAAAGGAPARPAPRLVLPYAVPIALATWLVIGWKLPTLDNPNRGQSAPGAPHATEVVR